MKIIKLFILFYLFFSHVHGDDNFENWLINFKVHAKDNGRPKYSGRNGKTFRR